ncbi:ring-1,2-phenylacetyl-CoA epoxidase subunit PaaA [Tumebacillus sp. BK434]|uniref:1,2-phenylacetyl-CoA epoxidase subunit PaaC n=1 Tax=Tumebacillus sp. BK434 TaxID=2512169 RepID=UPI001053AD3F|nr:Phenylacetic acid catabolic protein [Tumebacillus sp. BK434]TCP56051.1 ring-1,2-phenylacetyl-CoA epoxidase subunit PaaA [Tumebacillus sp. BK434]
MALSELEKEQQLLEKIASGETIESPEEMTEEYRENLIHLMLMQADSEVAGAFGYVPWIMKAPTTAEMLSVATITKDEVRHGRVMYKLLQELGVDVDARLKEFDFTLRVGDEVELGATRAAHDDRVNIFYYPINTWYDFIMFNVLMDRGAGHQLEDSEQSSYGPWRRVMEGIMKEELMHVAHGDSWLVRLGKDPEHRDATQEALDRWFPRVMNIFGKPNSRRNQIYRKLGLKKRDNHEVRLAFEADVRKVVERAGLRMPVWAPDWDKLQEDATITG